MYNLKVTTITFALQPEQSSTPSSCQGMIVNFNKAKSEWMKDAYYLRISWYEMYVFCKQMSGPPFPYDYWSVYGLLYLCLNLHF